MGVWISVQDFKSLYVSACSSVIWAILINASSFILEAEPAELRSHYIYCFSQLNLIDKLCHAVPYVI